MALLKSLLESRKTTDMRKEQELLQKALDTGMADPSLGEYLSCFAIPCIEQATQTGPDLGQRHPARKALTSSNNQSAQTAVALSEQLKQTTSYAPMPSRASQRLIATGGQFTPITVIPGAEISINDKTLAGLLLYYRNQSWSYGPQVACHACVKRGVTVLV